MKQQMTHKYEHPHLRFYGIDYNLETMDRATLVALMRLISNSLARTVIDLNELREKKGQIDASVLMSLKHRREAFKRMVQGLKEEVAKRPETETATQPAGTPVSERFVRVAQRLLHEDTFAMIMEEAQVETTVMAGNEGAFVGRH